MNATQSTSAHRVCTAIYDETELFSQVTAQFTSSNNPLSGPLCDFVTRRIGINSLLLKYIRKIYSLIGFTGNRTCGVRVGTIWQGATGTTATDDGNPVGVGDEVDDEDDDILNEDEDFQQEMSSLETFFSNLDIL
ncbi:hypothetical protein QCA50_011621 [Cerrena zonata]|uniref:Uncharacterized protein n=1 Tax=Cerrena zonata TaxID=2478898 RepID=A0AAW0FW07_9APHY